MMGKIDIAQMKFLRDTRHFADFWNGLAYDGEQIVKPELKSYMALNIEKKEADEDMCTAITELIEDGRIEGRAEGRAEGLLLANKLNAKLIKDKRFEDVERVSLDQEYQRKLLREMFPEEYDSLMGNVNK